MIVRPPRRNSHCITPFCLGGCSGFRRRCGAMPNRYDNWDRSHPGSSGDAEATRSPFWAIGGGNGRSKTRRPHIPNKTDSVVSCCVPFDREDVAGDFADLQDCPTSVDFLKNSPYSFDFDREALSPGVLNDRVLFSWKFADCVFAREPVPIDMRPGFYKAAWNMPFGGVAQSVRAAES